MDAKGGRRTTGGKGGYFREEVFAELSSPVSFAGGRVAR